MPLGNIPLKRVSMGENNYPFGGILLDFFALSSLTCTQILMHFLFQIRNGAFRHELTSSPKMIAVGTVPNGPL